MMWYYRSVYRFVYLTIILVMFGVAYGEAVDDGNNSAAKARPISLQDTISDTVSPDDTFDYYVLIIEEGDSITGKISFESKNIGTVLKITGPDGTILERSTTDESLSFEYTLPQALNKPGAYYARVSFWSAYAYDHEYTLTFDLKGQPGKFKQPVVTLQIGAPWPNERADARNTGRSGFPGPRGELLLIESKDLFALSPYDFDRLRNPDKINRFLSLRTGPDDWLNFVIWDSNAAQKKDNWIVAHNLKYGSFWGKIIACKDVIIGDEKASARPGWYVCYPSSTETNRLLRNSFQGYGGIKDIFFTGGYAYTEPRRLYLIGERVYASANTTKGQIQFQCFGKDECDFRWGLGGTNKVSGVCEDDECNAFLRWENGILSRFAADGDGTESWHFSQCVSDQEARDSGVQYFDLPILGNDGLVWVSSVYYNDTAPDEARKYGSRYHVIRDMSTSPSVVKQVGFPPGYRILRACCGGDGRIYLAMTGSYIACYENWDKKVWQVQLDSPLAIKKTPAVSSLVQISWSGKQGNGGSSQESTVSLGELKVGSLEIAAWSPPKDGRQISDMIMDHYNTIYVLCNYAEGTAAMRKSKLYILDPDDGSIISETDVDFPGEDGPLNSLAIGCHTKLLLLNSAGWLNVYKEKSAMPSPSEMGFVKKEQEIPR